MELELEDKILDVSYKVEQLGTIAWVAASASFDPEKCKKILDAVLYSIESLSKQIVIELDELANEAADSDNCRNNTSGDEWREELLKIYERLDLFGRAEVLVHADKVEKKALEQKS